MPRSPRSIRKQDLPRRLAAAWDALGQGAPELIDDADVAYFKATRSPRKKPEQRERMQVQRPLVNFLRRHLPSGSKVLFIPNGTARSSRNHIFMLIADGLEQGTPDLEIILPFGTYDVQRVPRGVCRIECKREEGIKPSDNQALRIAEHEALGIPCFVAGSVAEAVDWLRKQGVQIT